MVDSTKPRQTWNDVEAARQSVATTLFVNIKAIRDLMVTDAFEMVANSETFVSTEKTLKLLSERYLDRLKALQGGHANKTGNIATAELHEYMYYMQQYHDLNIDIAGAATQLSKILINLREQVVTQMENTHA
jgi:hypothetical protein